MIVLYPPFVLFVSRYAALVYECGEPVPVPAEQPPAQGTP
jgi:hypothetical protein